MDALPTMEGEMVGVLLFKPGSAVATTIENLEDGPAARRFFASGATSSGTESGRRALEVTLAIWPAKSPWL